MEIKTMALETEAQQIIIQGLNGTTYTASGFGLFLAYVESHTALFMVGLAFVTYITSTCLSIYWKRAYYKLEVEKMKRETERDSDDGK